MKFLPVCLLAILLSSVSAQSATPATGLIVDAKGLKFTPCMFPRLYASDGKPVWATYSVTSQYANDVGVAAFAQSLELASSFKDRGAPNQLVVRALRVTNQCDATIGTADAERVLLENSRTRFLEGFKVTFVY